MLGFVLWVIPLGTLSLYYFPAHAMLTVRHRNHSQNYNTGVAVIFIHREDFSIYEAIRRAALRVPYFLIRKK